MPLSVDTVFILAADAILQSAIHGSKFSLSGRLQAAENNLRCVMSRDK